MFHAQLWDTAAHGIELTLGGALYCRCKGARFQRGNRIYIKVFARLFLKHNAKCYPNLIHLKSLHAKSSPKISTSCHKSRGNVRVFSFIYFTCSICCGWRKYLDWVSNLETNWSRCHSADIFLIIPSRNYPVFNVQQKFIMATRNIQLWKTYFLDGHLKQSPLPKCPNVLSLWLCQSGASYSSPLF